MYLLKCELLLGPEKATPNSATHAGGSGGSSFAATNSIHCSPSLERLAVFLQLARQEDVVQRHARKLVKAAMVLGRNMQAWLEAVQRHAGKLVKAANKLGRWLWDVGLCG